jgi:eukaryotic-like serine/threonine-protein kinase
LFDPLKIKPGTRIDQRFEVESRVAVGGMGVVYRAVDLASRDHPQVALKILTRLEDDGAARFIRECEVHASIQFAGLVPYIAHGTERGTPYLALAWIDGPTLSERLAEGVLTNDEALRLTERLARTAGGLHERGIVHRDLKPQNVILEDGDHGSPVIVDLGIARMRGARVLTKAGLMVGSPGFMAPEQVRGEADVDARADVFALGCILFAALTGGSPFHGTDPLTILLRIAMEEAPLLSTRMPLTRIDVEALLCDVLAQDRNRRPRDGHALAGRLGALGRDDTTTDDDWSVTTVPRTAALQYVPDPHAEDSPSGENSQRTEGRVSTGERRFTCLVVCRVAEEAQLSRTDMNHRWSALKSNLEALSAQPSVLPDGTLLVGFAGKRAEAPSDLALRGARAGLLVSKAFPSCVAVVAFGRSLETSTTIANEIIARAVGMFTAISDTRDGGVILDEIAASLVESLFILRLIRRPDLEALRAFSIVRERAEGEVRPLLGKVRSFVGRRADLNELERRFSDTSEGASHALLVRGDAGSGKTRLLHEFIQRNAPRGMRTWFLRADASRSGAYALLIPLIHRLAGLDRTATSEQLFARLEERLTLSGGRNATRLAEFLTEMVGLRRAAGSSETLLAARIDAAVMQSQITRAFVDLCEHEAALGPFSILIDDLQFCDVPSRLLLGSVVAQRLPRVFIAAFTRTADRLGLGDPTIDTYELFPLIERDCARLVRETLGDSLSSTAVNRIVKQSGGNPFFLEELIRVSGHAPETVLAAVEGRLLALPQDARRVLRAASVFGDRFPRGGLVELVGELGLDAILDSLVRAELIEVVRDGAYANAHEYAFLQSLTKDAAYGKKAHASAGAFLEAADEADAHVLARHFSEADERSRAAFHFLKAAEHALAGGDPHAALACAKAGLENTSQRDRRARLETVRAQAALFCGDNVNALEAASRALELYPLAPTDFWEVASVAVTAASRLTDLGELDRFVHLVTQSAASSPGDVASPTRLFAQCVIELCAHGQYGRADQLLQTIGDIERQRTAGLDHLSRAYVDRARGFRALAAGNPGAFGSFMIASAEHFRAIYDERNEVISFAYVAQSELCVGNPEAAMDRLMSITPRAKLLGIHSLLSTIALLSGIAHAFLEDFSAAEGALREASLAFQRSGDTRLYALTLAHLSLNALAQGDARSAAREAKLAVTYMTQPTPARAFALACLAMTTVAPAEERALEEALHSAREAKLIVGALGGIDEGEALVHYAFARALHAADDISAARTAILAAKRRLVDRASRIAPASAQAMFLLRIPFHAQTIETARAWLGED